jgi:hypothetical protein
MDVFSVDFTQQELSVLRQSLDTITLQGKDAKFVATLQVKLESEIVEISNMLGKQAAQKQEELQQAIQQEAIKTKRSSAKTSE